MTITGNEPQLPDERTGREPELSGARKLLRSAMGIVRLAKLGPGTLTLPNPGDIFVIRNEQLVNKETDLDSLREMVYRELDTLE